MDPEFLILAQQELIKALQDTVTMQKQLIQNLSQTLMATTMTDSLNSTLSSEKQPEEDDEFEVPDIFEMDPILFPKEEYADDH